MEEVILTLCLFAVLDLCSVHPLSLAVKYSVLAPSPADGCKASCGAGTFIDSNVFAFSYSQFGAFYILGSVKVGLRLCSQQQLWWSGNSQPVGFGRGSALYRTILTLNKDLSGIRSEERSLLAGRFFPCTLQWGKFEL